MQTTNIFILTKWMVSSRVLPSKSCTSCLCVFTKTISLHSVFLVFIDTDLFFIILSYSYLTLPEKQSSSAVTWASPGCHVFLKGCLRGTLQLEPLLITCLIHLSSFWFHSQVRLAVHIPHSEMQFHFYCLWCHIVMLCCLFFFFSEPFQLAVISLGADVKV